MARDMSLSWGARCFGRRVQFQPWIFCSTNLLGWAKKWLSRIKIGSGDEFSVVARMERSGMRVHRPRITLRSIRATSLPKALAARKTWMGGGGAGREGTGGSFGVGK